MIFVVFAAIALGSSSARALGLVADDRFVRYEYRYSEFDPVTSGTLVPDSFFGPFSTAPQRSSIELTADGLGFDGEAYGQAGAYYDYDSPPVVLYSWAETSFSITFRVDGAGSIDLTGFVSAHNGESSELHFVRGSEVLYEVYSGAYDNDWGPVAFSGPLASGEYTLSAFTGHHQSGAAGEFDFTFSVRDTAVPVPEPATVVLLAAGLAGLRLALSRAA